MYTTTARNLIDTYRFVKVNPTTRIATGMWDQPVWTATEFFRWFRRCLDNKINTKGETVQSGRKFTDEYQSALKFDVRTVNEYHGQRIRNTGCRNILRTPELKHRYGYVNSQAP